MLVTSISFFSHCFLKLSFPDVLKDGSCVVSGQIKYPFILHVSCLTKLHVLSNYFTQVKIQILNSLTLEPFPKQQILDSSKLKEFADDNLQFDGNGCKFSEWVENTV